MFFFTAISCCGLAGLQQICQNKAMRGVIIGGSTALRLSAIIFVIVGLIGMHQLVNLVCSAMSTEQGSTHSQSSGASQAHGTHETHSLNPSALESSIDPMWESDSRTQQSDLGMACVAILIIFVVAIPLFRMIAIRRRVISVYHSPPAVFPRAADPPDLKLLSISRT